MLDAVFSGHNGFVVVACLIAAATGYLTFKASRARWHRPVTHALWLSSAVSVVLLTMWSPGGSLSPTSECVINKDLAESFTQTQGIMNMGMFIPFGLLGVLATRRPALVVPAGILLSATIEVTQATVPFLSRTCDTTDLLSNSAGTVIGVALGLLLTLSDRQTPSPTRLPRRHLAIGIVAITAALAGAWTLFVTPVVIQWSNSATSASDEQRRAIEESVQQAFDGHYTVRSTEFVRGQDGTGTITAILDSGVETASGSAELSWPDQETFDVHVLPSVFEAGHSYPITETVGLVSTQEEAEASVKAYAERFMPWGVQDSELIIQPVDDGNPGWLASWRRWDGDVLLPMRLDVTIEADGNLTDLLTRQVDDPELPEVTVTEDAAWQLLEAHFSLDPTETERFEPVHLAARYEGEWRVHWLMNLETGTETFYGTVDATTGEIHSDGSYETPADDESGSAYSQP
ncbi:VanZ family protein [Streptomyces sp. NRRL F-2890]|uniref:VanZ family protein n=1 Tax=Streptomyces sp. NRRL F-2890 TaxID=1463845 RepID=UPI0004C678C4|nr:VanZ family protein [Streptomyces sp. NRRL F-2890]